VDELLALDAELAELRLAGSEAARLRVEASALRHEAATDEEAAPEFARQAAPAFALKLRAKLDQNRSLRSRVERAKPLDSADVVDNPLRIRTENGRIVGIELPVNGLG
jgi:hypothetical protein